MQISSPREPAVAGSFYPSRRDALAATVDSLLATAPHDAGLPAVRMMLLPHAGYVYSGAIAARGFSRLRASSSPAARVFIIGPSHTEAFPFTSVYDGVAYRTPLGDLAVDDAAAHALSRSHASIRRAGNGHRTAYGRQGEHAIEVELPFLQRIACDARIVPIIMGSQSWTACEALGIGLRSVVDWDRDVIVASSDLSHFHGDRSARALDGVFCETLMRLDATNLHARLAAGDCEACGGGPVVAALIATESLKHRACEILARGNSGDTSGDRDRVVGYAAAIVTGDAA